MSQFADFPADRMRTWARRHAPWLRGWMDEGDLFSEAWLVWNGLHQRNGQQPVDARLLYNALFKRLCKLWRKASHHAVPRGQVQPWYPDPLADDPGSGLWLEDEAVQAAVRRLMRRTQRGTKASYQADPVQRAMQTCGCGPDTAVRVARLAAAIGS